MQVLRQKITQLMTDEPNLLPGDMAIRLGVSEYDVVCAFPHEMVSVMPAKEAQSLLETIAQWGPVTVIVQSGGSIFEVKAPLPRGKVARGYYNLMGEEGQLYGHLKLDAMAYIALLSRPFMGKESHYFGFFSKQGDSIFKIYLGRDEQRRLFPEQVEKFIQLKQKYQSLDEE
ncbi:heme utilization cystosolic carrier protein HutX [Vibrio tritonius]|uniref:heme utilization cystosolic carrier protein HutX n=1 Tax=Vibrio tritonius TaxID=1435069 RepID=UPI000838C2B5|nr:heme utilization cystosolic carrier protein HutX [Vibrio tritonius]